MGASRSSGVQRCGHHQGAGHDRAVAPRRCRGSPAAEVDKLLLDHQRAAFEKETRRAARQSAALPAVEGMGLKPWREVIAPHTDVATGRFNAYSSRPTFTAWRMTRTAASTAIRSRFFQRTYLTEGLRDLLTRAVRRVSGDENAAPVINLQTNFGGGKTHSMLALYHVSLR